MHEIIIGDNVFNVQYAGLTLSGDFKTRIYFEEMGLGQVASIVDGNGGITYRYYDEGLKVEKEEVFVGYSKLYKIEIVDDNSMIAMCRYVEPVHELAPLAHVE